MGFTGQDQDVDLGLTDMKGRMYDPLAGRFATADPVMQAPFWSQGLNRYSYVFNDPINNTDPSGFESIATWLGAAAFAVGDVALLCAGTGACGGLGGVLDLGINLGTTGLNGFPGAARPGMSFSGPVPTAAPAASGVSPGSPQATGQISPTRAPVPALQGGRNPFHDPNRLAQAVPAGEGAPAYEEFNDGTGGGVPKYVPTIVDKFLSLVGGEISAAINIIVSVEQQRQAWVIQEAAKKAAKQGTDASPQEKQAVRQENRDAHGGQLTCENCGREDLVDPQQARGGAPRPENEAQVDHIKPKAVGGRGQRPNLRVLCPACNKPGVIPR